LQAAREQFQKAQLGLAAASYDTSAILQDFSARHNIAFPLLADPDSEIIRAYGVLNGQATGFSKGMAVPGYFYIGTDGLIREKYFESDYTDRYTANNLLLKIFPQLVEGTGRVVASPRILLTLLQSDRAVVPGSRFTLTAEIDLPPNAHVYAPGVKRYKPIQMILDPIPELKLEEPQYPKSNVLFLPVIQESVPVFDGKFRISGDAVVSAGDEFVASLGAGRVLSVHGTLRYQVCDSNKCYLPEKAKVSWDVQVVPLDRERSPEAIRHK
jgi:hypothetical protein